MVDRQEKRQWGQVLPYVFGGGMCLLAVLAMSAGAAWYWAVVGFCTGAIIILGSRRIFAVGVTRTADAVICRYVPWYEGNAYGVLILLPLMGVAAVAAGYAPGNPVWLRFGGIILLGLTPLMVWDSFETGADPCCE